MPVAIDCSSVISGWLQSRAAGKDGSFPYRGYFRNVGANAAAPFKVDAHIPEYQAEREGWHGTWRANDTADWLAKEARAKYCGYPREWIADRRARGKLIGQLLESLGPDSLWHEMFATRPAAARSAKSLAASEPQLDGHLLTATAGGGWACLTCGAAFRTYQGARSSACPGGLPAAVEADPSHALHVAEFSLQGGPLQPLVVCSRCGAHGASRVANLGRVCPAAGAMLHERSAPHRRQAALAAKGLHPSRKGVELVNARPLRQYRQAKFAEISAEVELRDAEAERARIAAESALVAAAAAAAVAQAAALAADGAHRRPGAQEGPAESQEAFDDELALIQSLAAEAEAALACPEEEPPHAHAPVHGVTSDTAATLNCTHDDEEDEADPFGFGGGLGPAAYE